MATRASGAVIGVITMALRAHGINIGVVGHRAAPAAGRVCTEGQPAGRRVVSVADLHGDFHAMAELLTGLKLVREGVSRDEATWKNAWVGDDALLVQLGDVLGRGADGRMMYRFLWALQDQAAVSGGEVFLLLGNHELLVLRGVMDYVGGIEDKCAYTQEFSQCVKSPDNMWKCQDVKDTDYALGCLKRAWAVGGDMGDKLRKRVAEGKMNMVKKVGDLVFVHAGLVPEVWSRLGGPDAEGLEWLSDAVRKINLATSDSLLVKDDHPQGPAWTRLGEGRFGRDGWWAQRDRYLKEAERQRKRRNEKSHHTEDIPEVKEDDDAPGGRCHAVRQALLKAGGERMVIGHNPRPSGDAEILCGGRLLLTDTFMSIAYTIDFKENDRDQQKARQDSTRRLLALETSDAPGADITQVYAGREGDERCRPVAPVAD
uniref:Calcineurin-like phosphoesterase domain-containing protein n=1 Tax=Zooxanthella nutricula TaxID=1333877 RepID=A0A7S2LZK2_9DINO